MLDLHYDYKNFAFSSNNQEFCRSLEASYYHPVLYLPNLYDLSTAHKRHHHHGLHIASFGACRLLKMHPTAALAALQLANRLDRQLTFYVNVDDTPGKESVRNSVRNILRGKAELVELSWQNPEEFRETVSKMDLVLQLSATETFCMIAADAIAAGVPVVAGPAVAWLPEKYRVPNVDEATAVAEMGVRLLQASDRVAAKQLKALHEHINEAKKIWSHFLKR
jgi:glycosyltransferase involved in cell wall biosynthesis